MAVSIVCFRDSSFVEPIGNLVNPWWFWWFPPQDQIGICHSLKLVSDSFENWFCSQFWTSHLVDDQPSRKQPCGAFSQWCYCAGRGQCRGEKKALCLSFTGQTVSEPRQTVSELFTCDRQLWTKQMQNICAEVPPHFRSKKIYIIQQAILRERKIFSASSTKLSFILLLGFTSEAHIYWPCPSCPIKMLLLFQTRTSCLDVKRDGRKTISSGTWWGKKSSALSLPRWRMSSTWKLWWWGNISTHTHTWVSFILKPQCESMIFFNIAWKILAYVFENFDTVLRKFR